MYKSMCADDFEWSGVGADAVRNPCMRFRDLGDVDEFCVEECDVSDE